MQSPTDASALSKVEDYLENVVSGEPSIFSAAVMTADGLPLVVLMGKEEVEKLQLAAAIASLGALSEQTAMQLGIGRHMDLMMRCRKGHLFIRRVGNANVLAIITDKSTPLGVISLIIDSVAKRVQRLLR